ncbi:MAG: hypothetical protein KGI79_03465 [Patescibacteria group bacterium]|nr:hypothetical protein [Patescibacteria group bacterium]MDE2116906.1 hypothetical protein [Patescibacteria group bacterium]
MKRFFVFWAATAFILAALAFGYAKVDLLIHGSMPDLVSRWQWWDYFRSDHSVTVLYALHFRIWLAVIVLVAAVFAAVFKIRTSDD